MYFNNEDIVNIDELVNSPSLFYAHIKDGRVETLKEHSDLVVKYFMNIFNSKNLEDCFLNFENNYLKEISEEGRLLFRKLLINVFIFHDLGKINPNFQKDKLKNKINIKLDISDSNHSNISSVLYFDYFINDVKSLEKKEMKVLRTILILNAYIISRHHSPLGEFNSYLEKYSDNSSSESAQDILELFQDNSLYKEDIHSDYNKLNKIYKRVRTNLEKSTKNEAIYRYAYMKLVYSLLLASDFYATSEFSTGTAVKDFGNIHNIDEIYLEYKDTEIYKSIRDYESNEYHKKDKKYEDINSLRSELFLDAENKIAENKDSNIFFLEAPTGSGKSNTGFNLSFKLMEGTNLKKIFYIYPYNTLVEQNRESLTKIFKDNINILSNISVVNSINPIKASKNVKNNEEVDYKKSLLDRQFLNYPIVLSTHVNLFNIMFSCDKGDSFALYQLANSVIVLDEIQSYKSIIWGEIISFLQVFAKFINIKIIIMSATLPDLEKFVNDKNIVKLIDNRDKYFKNPLFKDRVKINYELLNSNNINEDLFNKVISKANKNKVLVEFIRKDSAYNFYERLKDYDGIKPVVELITGDDNEIDRKKILNRINSQEVKEKGIILVATQVVEAGVDIDMDIGFKDISKLDSEEQFMGRLNRSCLRSGLVYFFNMDSGKSIYKEDVRIQKELTLEDDEIREILKNKDFDQYYNKVISIIKRIFNDSISDTNLEKFFSEDVAFLNCKEIQKRMKLIDDDRIKTTVFVNRELELDNGEKIIGSNVWNEYCSLLDNNEMEYSEKRVKLSGVMSKLVLFTYEIMADNEFIYNDKRGDIYYIENGEQYFVHGKFNKNNLLRGDEFI